MNKKSGFTIIEVVLVLGIAGLIFMMAFIALPSLWASQRDADRKANVMKFVSDIKTYQTNNSRGALPVLSGNGPEIIDVSTIASGVAPSSWGAFIRDYVDPTYDRPSIDHNFQDPEGRPYSFRVLNCVPASGTGELAPGQPCAYDGTFSAINATGVPNSAVDYVIYVLVGATCDGDQAVKTNSTRSVAAMQVLERSGRYCYNT